MSHWNHRLVKDVESGRLAIHEVYYDNDGTPTGYTENPVFIDTFQMMRVGSQMVFPNHLKLQSGK